MSHTDANDLSVSIVDLPQTHVAFVAYRPSPGQQDFFQDVRACFQRLHAWASDQGYDPFSRPSIGIPVVMNGAVARYECCLQVPPERQGDGERVDVQDLPGGRYAVLTLEKDSASIGPAIGRFYSQYVPTHALTLDPTRPTLEVYYEHTMEYCVAIGGEAE